MSLQGLGVSICVLMFPSPITIPGLLIYQGNGKGILCVILFCLQNVGFLEKHFVSP